VSAIRLATFSDGVFAIAVTLLAFQLPPPNLAEATTAGAVLHALGQQLRPFGFYIVAFVLTGRLWIEHHQLLDPLETHGRRLARVNLWFLLTVSLLPYWVNVIATYPNHSAATGLFLVWLGVAQFAFVLLCVFARRELAGGAASDALILPHDDPRRQRGVVAGRAGWAAGRPGAGARPGDRGVAAAAGGRGPLGGARVVGSPSAPNG
jgi:uncharacterized membrane protein